MKNYKNLVPILLIVLFAASVYMLFDTRVAQASTYRQTLEDAREYRAQGIWVDAESRYKYALEQQPSLELYLELGEMYLESDQGKKAVAWGETITKDYPTEAAAYEYLMEVYHSRLDHAACFELAEVMAKRSVSSKKVDEIMSKIEYTFFCNGSYTNVGIYSGGLCPVEIKEKWGYINQTGKVQIKAYFSYAGPFIGDLAPVLDAEGEPFFIDTEGNRKHVVLGVDNVVRLELIEREMFPLFNGEKWGFYNLDHEHVFGSYDDVSALGNGIAAVKTGDYWSLVDRSGKDLTGKTYLDVQMDDKLVCYRNERLFVSDGEVYRMIDSTGKQVGKLTFEDARIFNDTTYAAVEINGKWGFVDNSGKLVIDAQFEDARSFSNKLAAVKQGGKWGFIDMKGNMVIAPQFDDARDFNSSGCVFVLDRGYWGLLKLYKYNH